MAELGDTCRCGAHKAGEDEEQIRAFEFPGPASSENVEAAIVGSDAGGTLVVFEIGLEPG